METEKIAISTPFIKLSALLKHAGLVETGGVGGIIISDGLVSVNGETCMQRGRKIYPGDRVIVDNKLLLEVINADNQN